MTERNEQTTTIGQAVASVIAGATKSEQQTKPSNSSAVLEHKRLFLETYKRWARIFKGKDGDLNDEKWLIAEYYDSLGHLSPAGLDALTKSLKATCTFFPTIKECLEAIKPASRYDWGHPFLNAPAMFLPRPNVAQLAAPRQAIEGLQ